MRLSEAIRLGAMMRPQIRAATWSNGHGTCAIGAAMEAVGETSLLKIDAIFPILQQSALSPRGAVRRTVEYCIWDMNDVLAWTREQIADWVETIELQQAVGAVDPVEGIAELTPVHARIGI